MLSDPRPKKEPAGASRGEEEPCRQTPPVYGKARENAACTVKSTGRGGVRPITT